MNGANGAGSDGDSNSPGELPGCMCAAVPMADYDFHLMLISLHITDTWLERAFCPRIKRMSHYFGAQKQLFLSG
jgi:hypothetical protein